MHHALSQYLAPTDILDWEAPAVRELAQRLATGAAGPLEVARRCFEWVRDEVLHSGDHRLDPVTCSASEVLAARTGYCFAKSHLLAALLRANGIPAGLCYQRLSLGGGAFCLHGLVAAWLPGVGWYRVDPRGNKEGVDARFTPPVERLAFQLQEAGEADVPGVWADPLPAVVQTLRTFRTHDALADNLPDLPPVASPASGPDT